MDVSEETNASNGETFNTNVPQTDTQMGEETDLGEKLVDKKSKQQQQKQQIKAGDQSGSINAKQQGENAGKKLAAKGREKKKKKKTLDLTDPTKIIQSILDKSSFKVPNLSQQVDEKFYKTPHYNEFLHNELRDILYLPTVGATTNQYSDIESTLLPHGIRGEVNISPSAVTSLNCIYQAPAKRVKFKRNKGGKQKQQVNREAGGNSKAAGPKDGKTNESNGGIESQPMETDVK